MIFTQDQYDEIQKGIIKDILGWTYLFIEKILKGIFKIVKWSLNGNHSELICIQRNHTHANQEIIEKMNFKSRMRNVTRLKLYFVEKKIIIWR